MGPKTLIEVRFCKQQGRCFYCERQMNFSQPLNHPDGLRATKEHLIPRCYGGGGGRNIVAACVRCNQARGCKSWLLFLLAQRKANAAPAFDLDKFLGGPDAVGHIRLDLSGDDGGGVGGRRRFLTLGATDCSLSLLAWLPSAYLVWCASAFAAATKACKKGRGGMCCDCKRQLIIGVGSAALIIWFAAMSGMMQTSGWFPVLGLSAIASGLVLYADAEARRSVGRPRPHLSVTKVSGLVSQEQEIRRCLRARLGDEAFASWFNAMKLENSSGSGVTVSFPVKFLRDYVRQHFYAELSACCQDVFPDCGDIRVVSRSVTLTED